MYMESPPKRPGGRAGSLGAGEVANPDVSARRVLADEGEQRREPERLVEVPLVAVIRIVNAGFAVIVEGEVQSLPLFV